MIIVSDDFLEKDVPTKIQEFINKENKSLFWEEFKSTNSIEKYPKINNLDVDVVDDRQDVHVGYFFGKNFSSVHEIGSNILESFALKHNIEVGKLLRVKANILYKTNNPNSIHPPHVDTDFEHLVLLYYVNNSDGETIIFNEEFNKTNMPDLTVNKKISPKIGRAVLFNGLNYHSSSSPKIFDTRVVININFIGKIK